MFGRRFKIFSLLGFEVGVDLSWLLLALLITWTLAVGYFPFKHPDLSTGVYWWMGVAGALGLFFSIIFHEFSHSLVARQYDLPISGITLFIFGGVAHMEDEPETPKAEFLMAVAGPIASLILSLAFYLVWQITTGMALPVAVTAVLLYLALINFILAVFNLVPAFPLDGGRMLRAILWGWKGNLRWASRTASQFGGAFGMFLIILGFLSVVTGNFVGGMWWFLIGLFIRGAASTSYQQTVIRETLSGVPVRRVMAPDPITLAPATRVADLVEDYFYRYYHKLFPVLDGERVVGCVTINQVKTVHREDWETTTVGDIMMPCDARTAIAPDADAMKAMQAMRTSGNSRLMVVEDGRLLGLLTMKDMLTFLSLKMELEEGEEESLARSISDSHEDHHLPGAGHRR